MKKQFLVKAILISFIAISNNAFALNKTWATDQLNAGENKAELSYASGNSTTTGTYTSSGTSFSINGTNTASLLQADYLFGVTDNLTLGIILSLSNALNYQQNYTVSSNSYTTTDQYSGVGDAAIGAQYLLKDKNKDSIGWVVTGKYTPSTASYTGEVQQQTTNGAITQAGVTGGAGNGYTITDLSTTVSLPITGFGDVYGIADYVINGSKSLSGVSTQYGNQLTVEVGAESLIGDSTTIRPFLQILSTGSGTSGTTQISSYTNYALGLYAIHDVTKNFSATFVAEYLTVGTHTMNYSNGNVYNFNGNGTIIGLNGSFFF